MSSKGRKKRNTRRQRYEDNEEDAQSEFNYMSERDSRKTEGESLGFALGQTNRENNAVMCTPTPMINLTLPTPDTFSFTPNEWHSWRNRFQRYRRGCGLDSTYDARQIDVLLFTMGSRSEDIFDSFSPKPNTYDEALRAFDAYFVPRRNIIYERTKFLRHKQGSDPSEKFITDLHGLAKTCAWGELNDEMVLLVLIIGMKDEALSDRLQLDSQLTLEKAINTLRQHEELERQKRELANTNVFMVNQTSIQVGKTSLSERAGEQKFTEDAMRKKCRKCGYNWHGSLAECPARKAKCDKCSEIGHFFRCCPSREKWMRKNKNVVKEIEQQDSDSGYQQVPEIFIGNIDSSDKAWVQEVKASCGNQDLGLIKFKLDTAADVTMIPVGDLGDFIKTLPLGKCKSPVFSAKKKERINILGTLRLKLEHKGVSVYDLAYISEEITVPLLSRGSCEELNLVRRIFSVDSHDIDWATKYPNLFQGLGNMKGEYKIEMKENAVPYAISTPRVVPIPLKTKVKEQLDDMLEKGVIVPVEHATDWCAPMVVCAKKGGGVRICVDLSKLNNSVKRRFYPIPKIELSLAEIAGAKYFSKIDANSGFWQLNLAEESQDYTTFITPFGRYKFRKLPFGITSAPEEFQRRMSKALEGAKNCLVHIDDCLIWGRTKEEHDECLRAVLERVQANGITLNKQKSEFCKKTVTFLGFVLSKDGIKPDPSKVQAIVDLPAPRNANEVQRFMGMITFLAKFIPNRSEILEPITSLLKTKNDFLWGPAQENAFVTVKQILSSEPCLTVYDPQKPSILSCDASKKGLGAVLLQVEGENKKPVAYISRTLTPAEENYSNIEREALACTWLSPRLQRFRMRMMRYDYRMTWTPGKDLAIADLLSRSPIPADEDGELTEEVEAFVHEISLISINTTDENVTKVLHSQMRDPICAQLKLQILDEWPVKSSLPNEIQEYFNVKDELSCIDGLLLRGTRMIIPQELRAEMLERLHSGHLGITKTRKRALGTMWWPGISQEIERKIKSCPVCIQNSTNHSEPLIPRTVPDYPWQNVSVDLFKHEDKWYMVIVDHYSRYFEVEEMHRMRASDVIRVCKTTFSRFGIPQRVYSDSGTQFHHIDSSEFKLFAKEWGFSTFRSSPHHHQGNGAAEAAVKVAKGLMKKNKDKFELALLSYRTSPLETGFSPSELMFGRKLRDNLPSTLVGNPVENKNFLERENKYQNKYKIQFDKRHGASGLSELEVGSMVWITDLRRHGKVVRKLNEPRSYLVETDKRTIRRNRKFLVPAPYYGGDGILSNCSSMVLNRPCNSRDRPGAGTVTRYGRSIKKPRRY
ncbi:uncharacterized protein K02A2.6-like [Macrosteles quadrilineatus]|uniref:uncharacterized protein K02A2.6-like n=1 Tax=Macrosteles quadrilineatus TaxID=74068 RepID=UPI0023E2DDC7|nr:uncharacterized protein K02A2.6-like [Macrosteles quadrilineatus]